MARTTLGRDERELVSDQAFEIVRGESIGALYGDDAYARQCRGMVALVDALGDDDDPRQSFELDVGDAGIRAALGAIREDAGGGLHDLEEEARTTATEQQAERYDALIVLCDRLLREDPS